MLHTTTIEWHDLRIDPDDLPGNGEPVIVTLEGLDVMQYEKDRMVWLDVTLQEDESGDGHQWITRDAQNLPCPVYYPVIAWAYPPEPYTI